jgi:hypothetical protein
VNKKEAKKTLLVLDRAGLTACGRKLMKVFCFFFSKKKFLLTLPLCSPDCPAHEKYNH